jgi:acyl-coenzyme A synthetase/AMP-(fatty) acid ligase
VGLGYLGDPGPTRNSFFADPIDPESATGRLYRTGDLVRFSGDRLDYLGRADRQIKVGGMRIELDEIELALGRLPEIQDCAAVAHHLDGRTELAVYYVAEPGASLPAIQSHLRSVLPAFMIPRRWVALDALPRNGSGKVDRRALQADPAAVPARPR